MGQIFLAPIPSCQWNADPENVSGMEFGSWAEIICPYVVAEHLLSFQMHEGNISF